MLLIKILTQLVYPLDLSLTMLLIACVLLVVRFRKTGLALVFLAAMWLWFWSAPLTTDWVRATLEHAYPPVPVEKLPSADAIVVLGGGMAGVEPPRLHPDLGLAADRIWHAARLHKAGKAPVVVLSGGAGWARSGDKQPEAGAMSEFLQDLGVPKSSILLESESRNTYENALCTKRLLDARSEKKILLVTSALHMRRAEAIFRSLGFEVVPAATDYEIADESKLTPLLWMPDAISLDGGSRALKEYLGLIAFRIRGK
jgi:uncharacterized SAM-binding protein YcdF (DUF218 family)